MKKFSRKFKPTLELSPISRLLFACKTGDVSAARQAINDGADPGFIDAFGASPLLRCIQNCGLETARLLLENGADPNSKFAGSPMLMHAVFHGHAQLVGLLSMAGADLNAISHGITPLIQAVRKGDDAMVEALLDHGAAPNVPGFDGYPPLYLASKGKSKKIKRLLLERGAIMDEEMVASKELFVAVDTGDVKRVKFFLRASAAINARDSLEAGQRTPLIAAIKGGCHEASQLLVKAGADLDAQNMAGTTPLMVASEMGDTTAVSLLLECGANVSKKDNDGRDALAYAVTANKQAVVRQLLKHGVPASQKDRIGETPLHMAAMLGNLPIVKSLLRARPQSGPFLRLCFSA